MAKLSCTARRRSADLPAIVRSMSNPVQRLACDGRAVGLVDVQELTPHMRPARDFDDVGGLVLGALVELGEVTPKRVLLEQLLRLHRQAVEPFSHVGTPGGIVRTVTISPPLRADNPSWPQSSADA